MKAPFVFVACIIGLIAAAAVLLPGRNAVRGAEETPAGPNEREAKRQSHRPPVEIARDRARLMHEIYASTLDVMHHRYFHGERAMVPARAMEDIFADMKRSSNVDARWISVNMRPMSIEHEPKSDFEKQAAKEIAAGKSAFERVEDGYLRRAGAISLTGGCINCHGGFSPTLSSSAKFAGLVISVPIGDGESGEPSESE